MAREINRDNPTQAEIKRIVREAIRSPWAWPGGYPVYVILADGELLCTDCARAQYREISTATNDPHDHSGWRALGSMILYESEDHPETCAHCSKELESAYGVVNTAQ